MLISFSTLGCPEWKWNEILATARDMKYDGIEVRGICREMFAPNIGIFSDENIEQTKKQLSDRGLEISILTTGAYLSDPSYLPMAEAEVLAYARLACKLGVKYIRVMGEDTPQPKEESTKEELCKNYAKICDICLPYGVTPLIETNGILASSDNMKYVMENVNRENAGVLWDIHHPYRYYGESANETGNRIGRYVKHVHIKDSYIENGKMYYTLMGYGDNPVREACRFLKDIGYTGYYSYEWVKRWVPELEGSGIAFHTYSDYMRGLENILK